MTDRPILFSAPMVRALLAGTKTQTRRAKGLPTIEQTPNGLWHIHNRGGGTAGVPEERIGEVAADYCRIGVGDRLYVRETHQFRGADYGDSGGEVEWFRCYGSGGAADNWDPAFPEGWEPSDARALTEPDEQEGGGITGYVTKRRPGIHMPRWASRITLTVTDVRVQRLQEISEEDAYAEGVPPYTPPADAHPVEKYKYIWERINGPGSWDANPWVAAYTFTVEHRNIDARAAA